MKTTGEFFRLPFCLLPTPLYRLANISKVLGKNIYIKRDDLTGIALGGNKVRKLEFLLAEAKAKGAGYVITTGGAQSNHAMLTAACAGRAGLKSILVLKQRGVCERKGNLLLDDLLGAEVRFLDTESYDDIYSEMERITEELSKKGHKAYRIPVGGSTALGTLGYVNCAGEIAGQAKAMHINFDHIICAVGSGGTQAGLAIGARLYMPQTKVTGISADNQPFGKIVPQLMRQTAELLNYREPVRNRDISLKYMVGEGYAVPSREGNEAIRLMAEQEGIFLDPVYTGKAFAGLIELCKTGYFGENDNILFLHSGGASSLFAY